MLCLRTKAYTRKLNGDGRCSSVADSIVMNMCTLAVETQLNALSFETRCIACLDAILFLTCVLNCTLAEP